VTLANVGKVVVVTPNSKLVINRVKNKRQQVPDATPIRNHPCTLFITRPSTSLLARLAHAQSKFFCRRATE